MSDVGDLIVRMVVSLGVVLGVVGVGYAYAKRRRPGAGSGGFSALAGRRKPRSTTASSLEIEGRTGLARNSSAIAVRFADKVVLVCVTDGAPATVLAEVAAEEWDREADPDDDEAISPDVATSAMRTPLDPNGVVATRPSFLDALRDATSRRP